MNVLLTEPTYSLTSLQETVSTDNEVVLPHGTDTAESFSYVSDSNEAGVLNPLSHDQLHHVVTFNLQFVLVISVPYSSLRAHDQKIPRICGA